MHSECIYMHSNGVLELAFVKIILEWVLISFVVSLEIVTMLSLFDIFSPTGEMAVMKPDLWLVQF